MYEGTHAVLYLNGEEYELSYFRLDEDKDNFFCYNFEFTIHDDQHPKVDPEQSYTARLEVNGDALWYLPWLWFDKTKLPKMTGTAHGSIFCPFGLSKEDEDKYDAINLIIASDVCFSMTQEVWKNLLLLFSDWLKGKSIPQHQEYLALASEVDMDDEIEFEEGDDEEDEN